MNTLKSKFEVYRNAIYGDTAGNKQVLVMRHAFCAGAAAGLALLEESNKVTRMPAMMKHRAFLISEQALSGCVDAEERLKEAKLKEEKQSETN